MLSHYCCERRQRAEPLLIRRQQFAAPSCVRTLSAALRAQQTSLENVGSRVDAGVGWDETGIMHQAFLEDNIILIQDRSACV